MTAIEFENISKQYRLGLVSTGTLSHDLNRFWQTKILRREDPYLKVGEVNDRASKGSSDYVWALKDINFKVEQGDVVGIIGRNGAGKSTLLKLLSRVTAPTTGTIRAKGRIASLLEVGTGFHPEMTGRENIYMNGAIMGMTRAEISRKLDEIVDFSGCERYLDTPVKRYSSGMTVRLGFAIAAHLEPEILVVDEVLAVGDAEFQKKAIGKMQDISRGEGRTVLFVSHNMGSLLRLCNHGVLLENGRMTYQGSIYDTIKKYLSEKASQQVFDGIDGDINFAYITHAEVFPASGLNFDNSSSIGIKLCVTVKKHIPMFVMGLNIYSSFQQPLIRFDFNDVNQKNTLDPGNYEMLIEIPPYTFSNGEYKIRFNIAEKNVRRFDTEKSNLYFTIVQSSDGYGNVYAEDIPIKSSILRPNWIKYITKI